MFVFKISIWLSTYFVFYILFSLNTLISIFCFIIIILLSCILLLQVHVEYITFLILLLYLGGILIFFLFTSLMLNNEYDYKKQNTTYSFETALLLIFFSKIFYSISIINNKIINFKLMYTNRFLASYITENYALNDLISCHYDIYTIINLYSEKYILLIFLGMILLYTMIGVIVITKNKNV